MKFFSIERIKNELLRSEAGPKVTAASFAVGASIAFCPFVGFHLILVFVTTKVFRLNGILVLLGSLLHNPWTLVFVHLSGLTMGDLALRGRIVSMALFKALPWSEMTPWAMVHAAFWEQHGDTLKAILKPFVVGSLINSVWVGFGSFYLCLWLLRRLQKGEGLPSDIPAE